MRKLGRSTGITLIELIVVVGLISLLMTLALAGIQAARESARTTQCANNLRQLGLALNAYESTHQMFPAGNAEDGTGPHFALLPQLDLQSLMAWCEERVAKKPVEEQQSYRVKLIGSKVVPVFSCPSDSSPDVTQFGARQNYPGNCGVWFDSYPSGGAFDGMFGYVQFPGGEFLSAGRVSDGLSNTIAFAEQCSSNQIPTRLKTIWQTKNTFASNEIDAFAKECESLPVHPNASGWLGDSFFKGRPWSHGNVAITLYNHVCLPNHPSCLNGQLYTGSAATAGSEHPHGLNVVFAGGEVRWVSDSVDRTVWRAWGRRDDNDVIAAAYAP